jgi:hypothetical protein
MNLNGRLKRLEAQLPPQPETEYTLADFANEVLKAIADGLIEDYSDKPPSDFGDYSGMTSPTLADNLSEEDRSCAWGLLHQAQKLVADVCRVTGWRSPLAAGEPQDWKGYRVNSCGELRFIMGMVYDAS